MVPSGSADRSAAFTTASSRGLAAPPIRPTSVTRTATVSARIAMTAIEPRPSRTAANTAIPANVAGGPNHLDPLGPTTRIATRAAAVPARAETIAAPPTIRIRKTASSPGVEGQIVARMSVLVGAERVRRGAGVADRRSGFEVAQGDRHTAIRQQALDVVHPVVAGLDLDQAAERAPLDSLGREPIRLRVRWDDRQWQGHRVRTGPRSLVPGDGPGRAAEPNTPGDATTTR